MASAVVLVVVTVLTTSNGVATDTRFQQFNTMAACAAARDGITAGIQRLGGTLGRDAFVACYPLG